MNRTSKVAAIHDMSGLGRCSLTVVLPVLSAMGAQCCPLPTALLSAHTAFPPSENAAFLDLTGEMERSARHWAELNQRFDAVYSGFLGSERQLGVLNWFLDTFRKEETLVLVDPVMGDHGKVYRTYTPQMCALMVDLAARADLITPNLTEAALLLGEKYENRPRDRAETEIWLRRLSLNGKRSVVLTGVSLETGHVGAGCFDRERDNVSFTMAREEAAQFSGTGDLFASVVLGSLIQGESLAEATALAVYFVQTCVARTLAAGTPVLDGVQFEPFLEKLTPSARSNEKNEGRTCVAKEERLIVKKEFTGHKTFD